MAVNNPKKSWSVLGEVIRERRLELNLTQAELAQAANLPSANISRIERGEVDLSEGSLKLIGDALEISFSELVKYKEQGGVATHVDRDDSSFELGPYRGLRPFREQDSDLYFGREDVIEKLISKLDNNNFVGLVGASGSGKSSLLAAGLVPKMRQNHKLQVVSFRPGRYPLESLAVAIAPIMGRNAKFNIGELKDLVDAFQSGSGRLLIESVQQQLEYDSTLLLVIDQFEELYAQCEDIKLRKTFTSLLLDISRSHSIGMVGPRILFTIRGDYFGYIVDDRELAEELQDSFVYMPPMAEADMRRAIVLPAEKYGVTIDEGLVNRIITDAGEEPGFMPLIQYCLSLLWKSRRNGKIDLDSYDKMGGLEMAIANQAEQVFSGLSEEGKQSMRRLMSRLIRIDGSGTEGSETRRKLTESQASDSVVGRRVVEALVKARLLTTDFDRIEQEETIELAHESIIRHWGRLKTWLIEDRQFLLWQQTVEPICEDWKLSGKEDTYVLRGRLLEQGEEWDEGHLRAMQPDIREYLQASRRVKLREASARSEELALFLLKAKAEDISDLVSKLRGNREWVQTRLRALISEHSEDTHQWRLRLLLLPEDPTQIEKIVSYLAECEPNELPALLTAIQSIASSAVTPHLVKQLNQTDVRNNVTLRLVCALAKIDPTNNLILENAPIVAKTVVGENPIHVLIWTNALSPVARQLVDPLKQILTNENEKIDRRDSAALVLNQLLANDPVDLALVAVDSSQRVFERFFGNLVKYPASRSEIIKVLNDLATTEADDIETDEKTQIANGKRKAFAAIINSRLGEFSTARTIFKTGANPEKATQFVYNCKDLRVEANQLAEQLIETQDAREWYWLVLALGQFDKSEIKSELVNKLISLMKSKYKEHPAASVHAVTGWILWAWGYNTWVDSIDKNTYKGPIESGPEWFTLDGPCGPIPFVKIPTGNFQMGCSLTEDGAKPYETPIRNVDLTKPYALCAREITREEFEIFEAETRVRPLPPLDDFSPSPKHPVVAITWDECNEFASWLERKYIGKVDSLQISSGKEKRQQFRLPTEAEWERACRAGTDTAFNFGSDSSLLIHHAWYFKNSNYQATEHRKLPPNQFGLFNMHGNCWEWCSDFYSDYNLEDTVDPIVLAESDRGRILRGGCWNLSERYCRSACRNWHIPSNRNYYNAMRIAIGY